jgi:hypothetical protein
MTPKDPKQIESEFASLSAFHILRARVEGIASTARPGLPRYLQEGLVLPYGKSEAARFHVLAAIAAVCFAAWINWPYQLLSITAILAGCSAYYFFPLTEQRPRLCANRHGLFVDGFGLIAWNAIGEIALVTWPATPRSPDIEELHIQLGQPESRVLLVDWRRLPVWRLLMRLPWTRSSGNSLHINLQPFSPPAAEIHRTLQRLWRMHSGGPIRVRARARTKNRLSNSPLEPQE